MVSLKLDKNNNLEFNNDFLILKEKEAIIQDIKNLLLMFKTEYPFNVSLGIAWYEIATYNNQNIIKNLVKERILSDERIKSIDDLNVSFLNGKLKIEAVLNTTSGVINV